MFDRRHSPCVHFDAMATVFPLYDQGLYVKGGLGFGGVVVELDDASDAT